MNKLLFLATLVSIWGLSLVLASNIGQALIEDTEVTTPTPSNVPSLDADLRVVPSQGRAQPLDFPIQGSSPEQQNASGDLQQPQTADQLQPNAKLDDFPDDLSN